MTSLREAQRVATRERILDAFDDADPEDIFGRVNHAEVAADAGVSERTVWRYFPTQAALQEAWLARRATSVGYASPEDVDDLAPFAAAFFGAIHPRIPTAGESVPATLAANRATRDAAIRDAITRSAPHLTPTEVRAAAAVLQTLMRPKALVQWVQRWHLDVDHSKAAVHWAVQTLADSLIRGEGPSCPETRPAQRP